MRAGALLERPADETLDGQASRLARDPRAARFLPEGRDID